jgi:hypothetical protein
MQGHGFKPDLRSAIQYNENAEGYSSATESIVPPIFRRPASHQMPVNSAACKRSEQPNRTVTLLSSKRHDDPPNSRHKI